MYPDIPDPEDIRNDDILTHLLSIWVEGGDDIYIPDRAQNELAKIVASTYEDVYRQYFPDDKELANYDAFWLEENLSMNVPTSDGTPLREKMLREVFNTELEGSLIVNVGNKMKANIGYLHEQALKRASSAITGAKTVGQLQSLLLLSNKPTLAGIIAQAAEQRMDIGTTMSNVFERVIGGMPTFKPTFIGREGKPVDSNFKRFIQNLAQGGARAKSPIDTQIIDRDLSELPPAIQDKMSVELGESDPDVIADRPFLDRKGNIIFPRLFTPGGRLRTAGTIHTPLEKQMQGYQPLTITPVERAPLKAALEILIDKRDLPPSPSGMPSRHRRFTGIQGVSNDFLKAAMPQLEMTRGTLTTFGDQEIAEWRASLDQSNLPYYKNNKLYLPGLYTPKGRVFDPQGRIFEVSLHKKSGFKVAYLTEADAEYLRQARDVDKASFVARMMHGGTPLASKTSYTPEETVLFALRGAISEGGEAGDIAVQALKSLTRPQETIRDILPHLGRMLDEWQYTMKTPEAKNIRNLFAYLDTTFGHRRDEIGLEPVLYTGRHGTKAADDIQRINVIKSLPNHIALNLWSRPTSQELLPSPREVTRFPVGGVTVQETLRQQESLYYREMALRDFQDAMDLSKAHTAEQRASVIDRMLRRGTQKAPASGWIPEQPAIAKETHETSSYLSLFAPGGRLRRVQKGPGSKTYPVGEFHPIEVTKQQLAGLLGFGEEFGLSPEESRKLQTEGKQWGLVRQQAKSFVDQFINLPSMDIPTQRAEETEAEAIAIERQLDVGPQGAGMTRGLGVETRMLEGERAFGVRIRQFLGIQGPYSDLRTVMDPYAERNVTKLTHYPQVLREQAAIKILGMVASGDVGELSQGQRLGPWLSQLRSLTSLQKDYINVRIAPPALKKSQVSWLRPSYVQPPPAPAGMPTRKITDVLSWERFWHLGEPQRATRDPGQLITARPVGPANIGVYNPGIDYMDQEYRDRRAASVRDITRRLSTRSDTLEHVWSTIRTIPAFREPVVADLTVPEYKVEYGSDGPTSYFDAVTVDPREQARLQGPIDMRVRTEPISAVLVRNRYSARTTFHRRIGIDYLFTGGYDEGKELGAEERAPLTAEMQAKREQAVINEQVSILSKLKWRDPMMFNSSVTLMATGRRVDPWTLITPSQQKTQRSLQSYGYEWQSRIATQASVHLIQQERIVKAAHENIANGMSAQDAVLAATRSVHAAEQEALFMMNIPTSEYREPTQNIIDRYIQKVSDWQGPTARAAPPVIEDTFEEGPPLFTDDFFDSMQSQAPTIEDMEQEMFMDMGPVDESLLRSSPMTPGLHDRARESMELIERKFPVFMTRFLGTGKRTIVQFNQWRSTLTPEDRQIFDENWAIVRRDINEVWKHNNAGLPIEWSIWNEFKEIQWNKRYAKRKLTPVMKAFQVVDKNDQVYFEGTWEQSNNFLWSRKGEKLFMRLEPSGESAKHSPERMQYLGTRYLREVTLPADIMSEAEAFARNPQGRGAAYTQPQHRMSYLRDPVGGEGYISPEELMRRYEDSPKFAQNVWRTLEGAALHEHGHQVWTNLSQEIQAQFNALYEATPDDLKLSILFKDRQTVREEFAQAYATLAVFGKEGLKRAHPFYYKLFVEYEETIYHAEKKSPRIIRFIDGKPIALAIGEGPDRVIQKQKVMVPEMIPQMDDTDWLDLIPEGDERDAAIEYFRNLSESDKQTLYTQFNNALTNIDPDAPMGTLQLPGAPSSYYSRSGPSDKPRGALFRAFAKARGIETGAHWAPTRGGSMNQWWKTGGMSPSDMPNVSGDPGSGDPNDIGGPGEVPPGSATRVSRMSNQEYIDYYTKQQKMRMGSRVLKDVREGRMQVARRTQQAAFAKDPGKGEVLIKRDPEKARAFDRKALEDPLMAKLKTLQRDPTHPRNYEPWISTEAMSDVSSQQLGEVKEGYDRSTGEYQISFENLGAQETARALEGAKVVWAQASAGRMPDDPASRIATVNDRLNAYINEYVKRYVKELESLPMNKADAAQTGALVREAMVKVVKRAQSAFEEGTAPFMEPEDRAGARTGSRVFANAEQLQALADKDPKVAEWLQTRYGGNAQAATQGELTTLVSGGTGWKVGRPTGAGGGGFFNNIQTRGRSIWSSPLGRLMYTAYIGKRFWSWTMGEVLGEAGQYGEALAGAGPSYAAQPGAAVEPMASAEGHAARMASVQRYYQRGAWQQFGAFQDWQYAGTGDEGRRGRLSAGLKAAGAFAGAGLMAGPAAMMLQAMAGSGAATTLGIGGAISGIAGTLATVAAPAAIAIGGGVAAATFGMEWYNNYYGLTGTGEERTWGSYWRNLSQNWMMNVTAPQRYGDEQRRQGNPEWVNADRMGRVALRANLTEEQRRSVLTRQEQYYLDYKGEPKGLQAIMDLASEIATQTGEGADQTQPSIRALSRAYIGGVLGREEEVINMLRVGREAGYSTQEFTQTGINIGEAMGFVQGTPQFAQWLSTWGQQMTEAERQDMMTTASQVSRYSGAISGYFQDPRAATAFIRGQDDLRTQPNVGALQSLLAVAGQFGVSGDDVAYYRLDPLQATQGGALEGGIGQTQGITWTQVLEEQRERLGNYRAQLSANLGQRLAAVGVPFQAAIQALERNNIRTDVGVASAEAYIKTAEMAGGTSSQTYLDLVAASAQTTPYQANALTQLAQSRGWGAEEVLRMSATNLNQVQMDLVSRMNRGDIAAWSQFGRETQQEAYQFVDQYNRPTWFQQPATFTAMVAGQAQLGNVGALEAIGVPKGMGPMGTNTAIQMFRNRPLPAQWQGMFRSVGVNVSAADAQIWADQGGYGRTLAHNAEMYGYSMAGIGVAMQQIALQRQTLWGGGDWRNPSADSLWGMQDQMRQMQYQSTMADFAAQKERMNISNQYAMRQEGISWNRMMVGQDYQRWQLGFQQAGAQQMRGWTREDWQYQDTMSQLSYSWAMEDVDEAIRLSSGRERQQLTKQKERTTLRYNLQQEQTEETRSRQEELWAREDERFAKQQEYQEALMALDEEQFNLVKERREEMFEFESEELARKKEEYQEQFDLETKMTMKQREHTAKQLELQEAALGIQAAAAKEQKDYADQMAGIQLLEENIETSWKNIIEADPTIVMKAMEDMSATMAEVPKPTVVAIDDFLQTLGYTNKAVPEAFEGMAESFQGVRVSAINAIGNLAEKLSNIDTQGVARMIALFAASNRIDVNKISKLIQLINEVEK